MSERKSPATSTPLSQRQARRISESPLAMETEEKTPGEIIDESLLSDAPTSPVERTAKGRPDDYGKENAATDAVGLIDETLDELSLCSPSDKSRSQLSGFHRNFLLSSPDDSPAPAARPSRAAAASPDVPAHRPLRDSSRSPGPKRQSVTPPLHLDFDKGAFTDDDDADDVPASTGSRSVTSGKRKSHATAAKAHHEDSIQLIEKEPAPIVTLQDSGDDAEEAEVDESSGFIKDEAEDDDDSSSGESAAAESEGEESDASEVSGDSSGDTDSAQLRAAIAASKKTAKTEKSFRDSFAETAAMESDGEVSDDGGSAELKAAIAASMATAEAEKSCRDRPAAASLKTGGTRPTASTADVAGPSGAFSERERREDERKLKDAKASLESTERLLANPEKLPDGGVRLLKMQHQRSVEVKSLETKLALYPPKPSKAPTALKDKIAASSAFRLALQPGQKEWEELPATPKRQGPWKMPPPTRKNFGRLYADGHYGKNLFGGVMTEERMFSARAATLESIKHLHRSLESIPGEEDLTEDPAGLKKVQLMRHQSWGLTWMLWRESQEPPGGILADDMGLGKTLSIISLVLKDRQLSKDKEKNPDDERRRKNALEREDVRGIGTTLVVAPASVANQWAAEIQRRTSNGRIRCLVYHGPARKKYNTHSFREQDVVVTTYDVVSSEVGVGNEKEEEEKGSDDDGSQLHRRTRHPSPLMRVAWHRIVLDEAHSIKNHSSRRAKSLYRLRSTHRWCLSGTPIHNSLTDFYSLVRFLRLTPLDEISVWKEWIGTEGAKNQAKSKERLNTIVKAILLRRTKDQICSVSKAPLVSLPPKEEVVHELDLLPAEREIYDQLFKASQFQAAQYLHSAKERGDELAAVVDGEASHQELGYRNPFQKKGKKAATEADSNFARMREILVMLLRLRQAAVHLHLIREGVEVEALTLDMEKGLAEDVASMSMDEGILDAMLGGEEGEGGGAGRTKAKDLFRREWVSTKMEALLSHLRLIQERPGKDKVVIVSQWTSLLDLIVPHLRGLGDVEWTEISGKVPMAERQGRVDAFNEVGRGPVVMLLSLTAGGVGLNLTGANHLFLLDLHWNPALEQQAQDRIYRMGQVKPVFIHKFICKRTIEARVRQLQEEKKELAQSVLSGAAQKNVNKLTMKDLRKLFELDGPDPADDGLPQPKGLFAKQRLQKAAKPSIYAAPHPPSPTKDL